MDFQSSEALDEYAKLNPNRKFPTPLIDIAVIADFTLADDAKLPVTERASLEAWRRRMQERASWKQTEQRKVNVLHAAGIDL